jgi:competence protein CoiA
MDMHSSLQSTDSGHDAYEVGCDGLLAGCALEIRTGQRIHANEATKKDGPFICPSCLSDAVVRKCVEKIDHFAHKAPLTPVIPKGETELHNSCKLEIRDCLMNLYPDGKWACERPIEENKAKKIPRLVPDISGRMGTAPVVIEVQASSLTIPRISKRAAAYNARNIAVLWIVPLTEPIETHPFRPRLYERYLHSIYFGRTYYWWPGFGVNVQPVHYGIAYRYIDKSEWYSNDGEQHEAGGYEKPYKIIKKPELCRLLDITKDFSLHQRAGFTPWNERKAVPNLTTWQDKLDVWWDVKAESKFQGHYAHKMTT